MKVSEKFFDGWKMMLGKKDFVKKMLEIFASA